MRILKTLGVTLAVPVALVSLWTLASELAQNFFWPSPITIVGAFPATWLGTRLTDDVLPSLTRLLLGYVAALVIGILFGILVGSLRRLRLFAEPSFEFFRAIPPPILVPIMVLLVGRGPSAQVTIIAFGCIWPVLINTIEGVRGIDGVQLDTSSSYRIRGWRRLSTVVVPAASPKIVAGARQALSIGIIMMVVSEMFSATDGIGLNIIEFQRLFQLKEMWTGVVLLGIIGVLANTLFKFIERRVLRWHSGMQAQER